MAEPARYYTVKSLAAHWGVDPSTVYRLISERRLGHIRIGATIRVRPDHVAAYEESQECPGQSEPQLDTTSSSSKADQSGTSAGQTKLVNLSAAALGRQIVPLPNNSWPRL